MPAPYSFCEVDHNRATMAAPKIPTPTLATFVGPLFGVTADEEVEVGVAEVEAADAVLLQETESGRLVTPEIEQKSCANLVAAA